MVTPAVCPSESGVKCPSDRLLGFFAVVSMVLPARFLFLFKESEESSGVTFVFNGVLWFPGFLDPLAKGWFARSASVTSFERVFGTLGLGVSEEVTPSAFSECEVIVCASLVLVGL